MGEGENAALVGRSRGDELGQLDRDFFGRKRHADDAGRGWKYFIGGRSERGRRFTANLLTGLNADASGGAVGISGVHEDSSNTVARRKQTSAADLHGSGYHAVLRE